MTTKQRVKIATQPKVSVRDPGAAAFTAVPAGVQVVSEKVGALTFLDKAKGYYKGLITAAGAILVIANEVTPILNFLPGQDKQYITAAIAFVTTVSVFLKDNEHWVDDL